MYHLLVFERNLEEDEIEYKVVQGEKGMNQDPSKSV